LDKRRLRNTRFAEELSPRKKKLHLPRNEKIQSWCESTGQWELRSRNELRIYASCAPCKHGRAQDGWECWSMGHPCSIQRGLARRLCILLVCTDPLSALAPKLQEVYGPLRFGPRLGGGGHSAWCTRLAKELDRPPHHACEFLARLMGGRMLEIQCFSLTRQNYFDVRSLF